MKRNSKLTKFITLSIVTSIVLINTSNFRVFADGSSQDVLNAGKQIIQQYYIEDVSDTELNAATDMDSLVKSLSDPYSAYFTEAQYNAFIGAVNNSFAGIGIQMDIAPEGIKIVSVFDKTPASDAGLKLGDIITQADGHNLAGLSTEEVAAYLKGNVDTSVHIVVKRGESLLSFDITRKQITLPTVEEKLLDNHIGYIDISTFGENTAAEFKTALDTLNTSTTDSYVVDLRDNPGGYMNVALDIAGYFIGNNAALKVQPKDGQVETYNAVDHNSVIDKPVIFLINEYSASASEILSAAVKDYKKAIFIGEKTYGKGVAQSIFTLPDNSYLKLTTFRFVSPLGNQINKVGISPDIKVQEDFNNNVDSLNVAKVLFNNQSISNDKNYSIDKLYSIAYAATVNSINLKTQKSINDARENVSVLRGTDAGWAIGEFSKQVDKVQNPFLVNIVNAITKAQQSGRQVDINAARASIDSDLPQVWKNSYSSALDIVQQGLMKQLVDANNKAVLSKIPEDKAAVDTLLAEIKLSSDSSINAWADQLVSGNK